MSLKLCAHAGTQTYPKKNKKGLEELKHREDIVITNAEKGGAVVRLDVKDYIKESERQLNDTKQDRYLEHDPTADCNAEVNKVIAKFKNDNLICSNVSDGLKVESYIQQKIQKEENQGMPVKSSLNYHTSKIPEYADFHLQPIVKLIHSYVKDTTNFLCKLDAMKFVTDNAYLLSLDGKSLFTSIPNAEGEKQ